MNDYIEFSEADVDHLTDEEWLSLQGGQQGTESVTGWEADVELWDHDSWPEPPF